MFCASKIHILHGKNQFDIIARSIVAKYSGEKNYSHLCYSYKKTPKLKLKKLFDWNDTKTHYFSTARKSERENKQTSLITNAMSLLFLLLRSEHLKMKQHEIAANLFISGTHQCVFGVVWCSILIF